VDFVDDEQAEFTSIEGLALSSEDTGLLNKIAARYDRPVRAMPISRGLSSATKVVLKPQSLFPILVKIDDASDIKREEAGDRLLRERTPPLSMPPIEGVWYGKQRAAIAYRYITGGRVRQMARRFDTELVKLDTYQALRIIDDIFDVILKKCHWLDGLYELRPIQLPDKISDIEITNDPQWDELRSLYARVQEDARRIRAPHAIVHGDLHAKNILVTRDGAPVIIDFAFAASSACQYQDYAKLESTLQFQVDGALADQMWRHESLIYGPTPLIIPHSNTKLAACIHRVRANLWQGCTRRSLQMENDEIDAGYRSMLIYHFVRLYGRNDNSRDTKQRAYHQARGLASGLA